MCGTGWMNRYDPCLIGPGSGSGGLNHEKRVWRPMSGEMNDARGRSVEGICRGRLDGDLG